MEKLLADTSSTDYAMTHIEHMHSRTARMAGSYIYVHAKADVLMATGWYANTQKKSLVRRRTCQRILDIHIVSSRLGDVSALGCLVKGCQRASQIGNLSHRAAARKCSSLGKRSTSVN
jgi:hypothetical protein